MQNLAQLSPLTSQHGNENNMEDDDDVIYQGELFKLSESRKRLIGSKSDSWKPKYVVFRHKGEKPVLEYHKKKPKSGKKSERTLTDTFELWPTYKVEKLKNARGRTFVCEITSSDYHIFLSADEEKQIDVLVFLLQVQIRLKDNIRKDLISVLPDDSECQQKIGAKGSKCVLHASPWGLTLALEQTRALLAQWPLKSIRYYEASGTGHFNIEAGRVAPMGEGLFKFTTQTGHDDYMYDLVDNYIVNTLDRVKPAQKGTPEEIEDYIREHDHLHSLTTTCVCSPRTPEIRNILKKNWNIRLQGPDDLSGQARSRRGRQSNTPASPSLSSASQATTQSSSLVINLERPGESSDSRRGSVDTRSGGRPSTEDSRITDRPPPLPSRPTSGSGVPRRSKRRDHSIPRKVDVAATKSEVETQSLTSEGSLSSPYVTPRRHSNPSEVLHRVRPDEELKSLSLNINLAQNNNAQHHHTEFYNLSSPNMKVRVTKSPVVTKNPNKVGRAEYLMSLEQSGVKSPGSSPEGWDLKAGRVGEEDHQEALEYLDAVARASQQKYGGHNSIDRRWVKLRRELSGSDQSMGSGSNSPRVSASINHPSGYVNLPSSSPPREIHHSRQRSAPESGLGLSAVEFSRQSSKDSMGNDPTLSPPVVHHSRQRSADETGHISFGSIDPRSSADSRPRSAGSGRRSMDTTHHSGRDSDNTGGQDGRTLRQLSQFSGLDPVDTDVGDWLMSASCEDLSDHMRTVIYDDNNNDHHEGVNAYEEIDDSKVEGNQATISSTGSASSNEKPPLPFTGLKKFHDNTDTSNYRDRSKSFGYMNLPSASPESVSSSKPQSSAPSAHLIRKMVNARAKQETLRKSLSNPNFLNLGSKEHLFNLKSSASGNSGSSGKLATQHKQKSRSFGSLFPAIKKALSRESLGHSRSTTPERKGSRSTTPERRSSFSFKRRSSDSDNFKRQNSFHSYGELARGIRMTERSRSFRRVRGAKSVEVLAKSDDNSDVNRLSSATTVSSPAATTTTESTDGLGEPNRTSTISSKSEPPASFKNEAPASSRNDPPAPTASVMNPNYTVTAHLALTTPNLPPLPDLNQPPPLPAPRKKTSSDEISISSHMKKSGSISSSLSEKNQPYQNTPGSVQQDEVTTDTEESKSNRPHVCDIIAKIEENKSTDAKPPHQKTRRSEHRESASKPKSRDSAKNPRHSSSSQGDSLHNQRNSSHSHRASLSKEKTGSSSQETSSKGKRHSDIPSQPVDIKAPPSNPAKPSGSSAQDPSVNKARAVIGQAIEFRGKRMSSTTSQEGSSRSSVSSVKSIQNPAQQVPKPFQPIPFKRQQNGIRSVPAPTTVPKSESNL